MEISSHGNSKQHRRRLFGRPLYYAAAGGCYKRWKVARFREKVQGRMDGVKGRCGPRPHLNPLNAQPNAGSTQTSAASG
jgi:hypothetical protein